MEEHAAGQGMLSAFKCSQTPACGWHATPTHYLQQLCLSQRACLLSHVSFTHGKFSQACAPMRRLARPATGETSLAGCIVAALPGRMRHSRPQASRASAIVGLICHSLRE